MRREANIPGIFAYLNAMVQVKEALLKKHTEQVERVKKSATQFAITSELSKVNSEHVPTSDVKKRYFNTCYRRLCRFGCLNVESWF